MLERIDPLTAYALGWHVTQVVKATEPELGVGDCAVGPDAAERREAAAELVDAEERGRAECGKELARKILELEDDEEQLFVEDAGTRIKTSAWSVLAALASDVLGGAR
jgi:hypothetical protein